MTSQPKLAANQIQHTGSEHDAGNSGSAITINWANGNFQKVTLTDNATVTLGSPALPGFFQLRLIQDGASGWTVAWAGTPYSASRWLGATAAPDVNDIEDGETIVWLFYDGANFSQQMQYANVALAAGATLSDDTTTDDAFYPVFADTTSGVMTTAYVSSTAMTFNPSTGTFSSTIVATLSDERLKELIKPLRNSVDVINALEGKTYVFKYTQQPGVGLIAQDVEKVMPEAVITGSGGIKSLNYLALIAHLIEYVKVLDSRVRELEARDAV